MYKINKDEYFKYLDENTNLTNCQKEMLKYYWNELNTIYVDKKSNIQVKTLITHCYKLNLQTKIAKIKNLFYTFFDKDFTNELFRKITKNKLNDLEIINFVIKNYKNNSKNQDNNKLKNICSNWTYIIEFVILKLKQLNVIDNLNFKYMDVGCGSGNKTNKIIQELKLDYKNAFGSDISMWGPYNQKKYQHKFNFIEITDDIINIETNSIDFISCILMLHHVKNLDKIIGEIKRILKPNGILLIIEHNNYDDIDNLILDILHLFYGYIYDKNNRYLIEPDYSNYYNCYVWEYIFTSNGFIQIQSSPLFTELTNEIRYDNIFYSFYKKKL